MIHPLLLKGRFLFVVRECNKCQIYKDFVDSYNQKLKFEKMIRIIDCTEYYDFNIITNPIIRLFKKYFEGYFPILFIDGVRKNGATSLTETKSWIESRLNGDLINPIKNKSMFDKNCKYIKKGFFKNKILCN